MQKTTFIYALCEPGTRTVRYVGKADAPKKRLRRHLKYDSIKTDTHLGRWLRSLVSAGAIPNLVVLAEVPRKGWQKEEIRYIQSARILGLNLTNGTDGGDGGLNPSPETLRHMSESHKGFKPTPESNKKRSESMKGKQNTLGRIMPEEEKAMRRELNKGEKSPMFGKPGPTKGVPCPPERRAKISAALTGVPQSPESRAIHDAANVKRRGVPHSPERCAITSASMTPEVRARISATLRANHVRDKERDQEIEWVLAPYTLE